MNISQWRAHPCIAGHVFVWMLLLLVHLGTAAETQPVVINTNSILPCLPSWLDNETIVCLKAGPFYLSETDYLIAPSWKKYILKSGKESDAKGEDYGSSSKDGRLRVRIQGTGTFTFGAAGTGTLKPEESIMIFDTQEKKEKSLYSCPEEIVGISISPDSKEVAFSVKGDILTMDLAGIGPKKLIQTKEVEYYPTYSPLGDSLFFIRSTKDGNDLFKLELDSKKISQVTKDMNLASAFSISSDGKVIAFSSNKGLQDTSEYSGNIWLLDLSSMKVREVSKGGMDQFPSLSPNGDKIAFQRQDGFWSNTHVKSFKIFVIELERMP